MTPQNEDDIETSAMDVHVCSVVMGKPSAAAEFHLLLRSLRLSAHAATRIAIHAVVSNETVAIVRGLLARTSLAWVNTNTYLTSKHRIVALLRGYGVSIPLHNHHSGPWGLAKALLHEILPATVRRCIVVDTDILIAHDVKRLWRVFASFAPHTMQALPLERFGRVLNSAKEICSGISLQHFDRMRENGSWGALLHRAWRNRHIHKASRESHQGLIFLAAREAPTVFANLDVSWSLEACADFHGCQLQRISRFCGTDASSAKSNHPRSQAHADSLSSHHIFFGAMHANCLSWHGIPFNLPNYYRAVDSEDAYMTLHGDGSVSREHMNDVWRGFHLYYRLVNRTTWADALRSTEDQCALRAELRCEGRARETPWRTLNSWLRWARVPRPGSPAFAGAHWMDRWFYMSWYTAWCYHERGVPALLALSVTASCLLCTCRSSRRARHDVNTACVARLFHTVLLVFLPVVLATVLFLAYSTLRFGVLAI